ncbi:interleukin 17 receptor A1a [Megalops cyprinoides]|uniref:interleukin 17 receptor A1a n=1 Tax=Megalops cyprinoides TaxID=118141 RepID=UPI001865311B|nr:interleukin 17 receptor A1a [Megalops cyprinoides]
MNLFLFGTLLSVHWILTSALEILDWPPLNCTQEGLRCSANINNCLEKGWLKPRQYTPTGPKDLKVQVKLREDENRNLVPVIAVNWTAQADGSIKFMSGTEVHVLKMSSNQYLCVHYIFHNKMPMKKSMDEWWSFFLDRVVVDPGQKYVVSVYNLPKPNIGHDTYHVSESITIPGCEDAMVQRTTGCIKTGSQWKSNISLERSKGQDGKAAITVGFNTDEFSEDYRVSARCDGDKEFLLISKRNQTSLKVTFALDKWRRTCCIFEVEVQPFFELCRNDCIRHSRKNINICETRATEPPRRPTDTTNLTVGIICALGFLLGCGVAGCICLQYRRRRKDPIVAKISPQDQKDQPDEPHGPRKVLIIYSLDHPLHKDVVLKLCAFLRAKCGTDVVLDLLDTAWLGTLGRMQWLDWQKQQIEKSSDKILILCSRGVRAKWRAMCGASKVTLKEDARSPMGDMLTPALSLIIPDLLHAAAFEKYMVAYFDDVSCEDDVPAPFNITIKYKLMKHFEELYFRIIDKEKHEPWRINHVEGIAEDEYFKCPSGKALRDAVEAFHAYQLENQDWFEKECVDSEEEVAEPDLQHPLLSDTSRIPVLQYVPECREGPPVLVSGIEVNDDSKHVQSLIPLLNSGGERVSTHEILPGVHPEQSQVHCLHPEVRVTPGAPNAAVHLSAIQGHRCVNTEPVLQYSPAEKGSRLCPLEEPAGESCPVEDEEEPHTSCSPPSLEALERLRALQQSLVPVIQPASECVEDEFIQYNTQANTEWAQKVEVRQKRESSGSDQGYISRSSLQHGSTLGDDSQDPLVALSRLQEACFLNSLRPSGCFPNKPGPEHKGESL